MANDNKDENTPIALLAGLTELWTICLYTLQEPFLKSNNTTADNAEPDSQQDQTNDHS